MRFSSTSASARSVESGTRRRRSGVCGYVGNPSEEKHLVEVVVAHNKDHEKDKDQAEVPDRPCKL